MKTVRLFLGLFVIASVVYLGWKIVPVYVAKYQFEEAVDDIARAAVVDMRNYSDEKVRSAVLAKAQLLDLPVATEDIDVTRRGDDVQISAKYTVHVDVPIYPFDLNFETSSTRQAL
jgi:Domain of unknown function (DUF4845)